MCAYTWRHLSAPARNRGEIYDYIVIYCGHPTVQSPWPLCRVSCSVVRAHWKRLLRDRQLDNEM